MHIENLVKMANNISTFFQAEPEHATAVRSIADHLRKFWDPSMRKQIIEHCLAGGTGMNPLTKEAVNVLVEEKSSRDQCGDG